MTAEAHVAPPVPSKVVVAALEADERDELAEYLATSGDENMPSADWRRRMDLWWDRNPYFGADATRGWTVRADGSLVGFFGVVPLGFQIAGREAIVYGSTTWRVDAAHRHVSMAGIAKVLRYTRESLLFISTQTAALVKILEALKFIALPREQLYGWQPNTLPLRLDALAKLALRSERLTSIALAVPNAVARIYPHLVRARLAVAGRGLDVRAVEQADASFDALWASTRALRPTTNTGTAAFLNWHCFASSDRDRRKKLFACYRGDELVGFAVVATQRVRGRLVVHRCVDVWTDPAVRHVTDALVGGIVRGALRDGADLLEVPSFAAELRATTLRSGFLPRKLAHRGEYVLGPKGALHAVSASDAHLCLLQGDSGL